MKYETCEKTANETENAKIFRSIFFFFDPFETEEKFTAGKLPQLTEKKNFLDTLLQKLFFTSAPKMDGQFEKLFSGTILNICCFAARKVDLFLICREFVIGVVWNCTPWNNPKRSSLTKTKIAAQVKGQKLKLDTQE